MNKAIDFEKYKKEHPKEHEKSNGEPGSVVGIFDAKRESIRAEIRFELIQMGVPEKHIEKITKSLSYMTKKEARLEAIKNLREFWKQTDEYEGPPDIA